ncbi:uncharacterized protein LOC125502977 [Dendroctonus ponderosae]|uniref:uncharacterized protein LOC125502977 n=1 Tax=Dendroctonus ponderosae TaxID=77166 RepID=UPI0020351EBB|nr:uncharacterized protein LOC125502977 [Dendroctonus ponderosae]
MYSKHESLVGMLKPMMMFTGTWRLDETKSTVQWLYWLYSLIFQGFGLLFVVLVVTKFIEFVQSGADSSDIISAQVYLLSTTSISGKVLIYQVYKVSDIFKAILDEEENLWRSEDHEFKSAYQREIKYIRKWNWGILLSSMFTALALMSAGVASLVPVDNSTIDSDTNHKEEFSMFPIWLPYRQSDHRASVVALKCILTFVCASLYIVSCMIFVALMIYSVGLLKMQQEKIRKCEWNSYDMAANPSVDMKALIINNRGVFRFIKHVDKCIRYVILVDVLLSSINIASLATNAWHVSFKIHVFYLTNALFSNDLLLSIIPFLNKHFFLQFRSDDFLFSICFLLMQIVQVLVLGWFANDIIVQSKATADVLCNMNWHYLDIKNKKMFLMMLMQYQHVSVISIGPFGPMTIKSVISVIKAAYSYMMLMRTYK